MAIDCMNIDIVIVPLPSQTWKNKALSFIIFLVDFLFIKYLNLVGLINLVFWLLHIGHFTSYIYDFKDYNFIIFYSINIIQLVRHIVFVGKDLGSIPTEYILGEKRWTLCVIKSQTED